MSASNPYRWSVRLVILVVLLAFVPSAPCAMEYAAPRTDWAKTISWVAGADRRSAEEALELIVRGDSGLALLRLDASQERSRGPLATVRLLSAWLLAETAHTLGALPAGDRQA